MSIELPLHQRGIFCNRTLNLRSIQAIGMDMDYTLVHYNTHEWEKQAYEHCRQSLTKDHHWPTEDLEFDPHMVKPGLVIDLELGNVVKANRFGFVKRAAHGTKMLTFDEQRSTYSQVRVDLSEPRWVFLNTLFGLSEGCLYSQLVDKLDDGVLPAAIGYQDLYRIVKDSLDEAHLEGRLKAEILEEPERFIELDEELPLALQDARYAGKKLLLITNSEWSYTHAIMTYAFDRFLPDDMTWRDLFHLVIVSARKPSFFSYESPVFEVLPDNGLLKPRPGGLEEGKVFHGGHAGLVEKYLDVHGEDILYVGDHIFADVHVSKSLSRWRTALIVRELEDEIEALDRFAERQVELTWLMARKTNLEHAFSVNRLRLQRLERGYGPPVEEDAPTLKKRMQKLRTELLELDDRIAPLAAAAGKLLHPRWGLLMRAGNDKSHLARQIERYADIYTSRVSNLLAHTPFVYLRSNRGSLPHEVNPYAEG